MNITMNELLLLNKVKMGENGNPQPETVESSEVQNPQQGMNALTFLGMKNLMSNPKLAQEAGVPSEEAPAEEGAEAKSYVAPYSSNIAFQGGSKFARSLFTAAAIALAAGGTMSLTSCQDEPAVMNQTVSQVVNVSLNSENLMEILNELQQLRDDLANSNATQAQRMQELISLVQQLILMQSDRNTSDAAFQSTMLQNQAIIIALLQQSGLNQQQANAILQQLLDSNLDIASKIKVAQALILAAISENTAATQGISDQLQQLIMMLNNGQITMKEFAEQVITLLNSINANVANIYNVVVESRNILKGIKAEIIKQGRIADYQRSILIQQNEQLIQGQNNLAALIMQQTSDMNAGFEKVCQSIGMSTDQLTQVLMELGYTQSQIMQMSAAQIIKAINCNTAAIQYLNKQMAYLTQLVQKGQCSEAMRDKIIIELLRGIDSSLNELKDNIGNYYNNNQDITDRLDIIINQNDNSLCLLSGIYRMLQNGVSKEQIAQLIALAQQNNAKLDDLIELVTQINIHVQEGNAQDREIGNQILAAIAKLGADQAANFTAILNAINNLGDKAQNLEAFLCKILKAINEGNQLNDANAKAILEAIGKINVQGDSVDLSSLEAMMAQLLQLTQGNNNLLSSIDAKLSLIKANQEVIISKLNQLAAGQQDYNGKLNQIISLLNALNNKPGYNDAQVVAKLNEIIEILLNHEFCNCNCEGGNSGNHEGILDDIITCLNK